MRLTTLCLLASLLFVAQPISAQQANGKKESSPQHSKATKAESADGFYEGSGYTLLKATASNAGTLQTVSQETAIAQTPFKIRISQMFNQLQGHTTRLAIVYDGGTESISGFDFEFSFASDAFKVKSVSPGSALLSAGWTNFNYDMTTFDSCSYLCPNSLLNINSNNASSQGLTTSVANTTTFSPGDTLALVNVLSTNDRNLDCTHLPLAWYWSGCHSNTLTSTLADTVYQSSSVLDYIWSNLNQETGYRENITGKNDSLPGPGGMPTICDSAIQPSDETTLRFIDFFNGGVFLIGCEIDASGDINLNGLSNEIADLEMFAAYFAMGRTAFGTHQEGSIAASEVNGDGIPLTVSDMVYLIHIILGDAMPIHNLTHERDTVTITQRGDDIITDMPLGALHLVFEGETRVELANDSAQDTPMTLEIGMVDGNTHVLIYDLGDNLLRAGAILNKVQTKLLSAGASDFNGSLVAVKLDVADPDDDTTQAPFVIRLSQIDPIFPGRSATIPVIYEQGSEAFNSFDFSVQFDPTQIDVTNVFAGAAILRAGWTNPEFSMELVDSCIIDCPRMVLNFSAHDLVTNMSTSSSSNTIFAPGDTLAVLEITRTTERISDFLYFLPMRWNWNGCESNTLRSTVPNSFFATIYQSRKVYDYVGTGGDRLTEFRNDITNKSDSLPGAGGIPLVCDSSHYIPEVSPKRYIDFKNGGLHIFCGCEIDPTGDLNLNGLAYEFEDLYIYVNYFTQGVSAFGINIEGQTYVSEINGDEKTLTVSDMTYLIRVTEGNSIRIPLLTHERDTVTITQRGDDIYTDMQLGALHLVFEGETTVQLEDDDDEHGGHGNGHDKGHGDSNLDTGNSILLTSLLDDDDDDEDSHDSRMTLEVGLVDGNTHVLIYNIGNNQLKAGEILDDVHAKLLSADASDFNGSFVVVRFDFATDVGDGLGDNGITLPTTFALHQNYPNPFNPTTTIEFSLPKRGDVELTIYNMLGQRLRTLVSESKPAGEHSIVWDGQDNSGSSVASGMYLYRLKVGENISQTRKMVLLK